MACYGAPPSIMLSGKTVRVPVVDWHSTTGTATVGKSVDEVAAAEADGQGGPPRAPRTFSAQDFVIAGWTRYIAMLT